MQIAIELREGALSESRNRPTAAHFLPLLLPVPPFSLPSLLAALSAGGAPAWRRDFFLSRQSAMSSSVPLCGAAQLQTRAPVTWETCLRCWAMGDLRAGFSPVANPLQPLELVASPVRASVSFTAGFHSGLAQVTSGLGDSVVAAARCGIVSSFLEATAL